MNPVLAVVIFAVGLFVVAIGLHEWGHYATAKRFGMRADKFFIGFGPTLWSTRRGETEVGVKALPLGGFVRIKGMSPSDERLRPVADQVFDPEAVAADRRELAEESGDDVTQVPAVPDQTWRRLDHELEQRGVDRDLRVALVKRTQAATGPAPTAPEARLAFNDAADDLLPPARRVGDLRHRVLRGDEGRFFHDRPAWQRSIVLVAGSTMHFVLAVALLFVAFWFWGEVVTDPVVDNVIEQVEGTRTPAAEIGLQPGDRFLTVEGQAIDDFDQARALLSGRPGEPTDIVLQRGSQALSFTITPIPVENCDETGACRTEGLVGFQPVRRTVPMPIGEAAYAATLGEGGFVNVFDQTLRQLYQVFGPEGFGNVFQAISGVEERGVTSPASPIGIGRTTYQLAEQYGPYMVLAVLALVNVFIGIFNLVPLPPLDGGHLAVVGIEKAVNTVRGARGQTTDFTVDPRAIAAVAVPVVVLLGTLFFAVLWLDIVNPIDMR